MWNFSYRAPVANPAQRADTRAVNTGNSLRAQKRQNCDRLAARITLDTQSTVPLYQQIARSLELSILGGVIASGAMMPGHRMLASALNVDQATIARAYKDELAEKNLVSFRRGFGTFVEVLDDRESALHENMIEALQKLINDAASVGVDGNQFSTLFATALKRSSAQSETVTR
jgi:DNA-binding transcriptional regulator YhcF (GntR family)